MNRTQTVIIFMIFIIVFLCVELAYSVVTKSIVEYIGDQELRDENNALKFYQNLIDRNNIIITYNGCEDMREQLGLDKE